MYDRPFLAPLFSISASTMRKYGRKVDLTNLPHFINFYLLHLQRRLEEIDGPLQKG